MVVGAQDFWVAGGRVHFQRDTAGSPLLDLGVVDQLAPNISSTKATLRDSDGGVRKVVDEQVIELTETWQITLRNFAPIVQQLLFLSNPPEEYTQAATPRIVDHVVQKGYLLKLKDSVGEWSFNERAIYGVAKGSVTEVTTLTGIDASAKTLTFSASPSTANGAKLIVTDKGLTNATNAKTYTQVGAVSGAGPFVVTVAETPAATETGLTGTSVYKANAGTIYSQNTDWNLDSLSLSRGYLRILEGGAITDADTVQVYYTPNALSGKRIIHPLAGNADIRGTAFIYIGRGNNAAQTVRVATVKLAPSGLTLSAEDYSSWQLEATIVSDITETNSAGSLISILGALPATS